MTLPSAEYAARLRNGASWHNHPRLDPEHPDYENIIGAEGERFFANAFGLPWKLNSPGGDGGVDFRICINGQPITFDIKTFQHPFNLLVKVADIKQAADIFVLCGYWNGLITMLGWDHRAIMVRMPVVTIKLVPSYCRPRENLRPMGQLIDLMARRDQAPHVE